MAFVVAQQLFEFRQLLFQDWSLQYLLLPPQAELVVRVHDEAPVGNSYMLQFVGDLPGSCEVES